MGRAARRVVSRGTHGDWRPSPRRADPVDLLVAQGDRRVQDLLPIRHTRMAASPFAFFRGSAAVMTDDLGRTPVSGLVVQACGDAHVANFGVFASPERNTVFDINDFDETLPAPWEWDVKRLVASIDLVARSNDFASSDREKAVRSAARSYRVHMAEYADRPVLATWYDHIGSGDVVAAFPKSRQAAVRMALAKSERKTSAQAVGRLTEVVNGALRFRTEPPLLVRLDDLVEPVEEAEAVLASYRMSLGTDRRSLFDRFELVDVARKVVGVGSVGTRSFIALFAGPSGAIDDHLVLQVKEAGESVLATRWPTASTMHQGERVVTGQRLMQASSDVLLGWTDSSITGRHFYVRQLWDTKGSADLATMRVEGLSRYGGLCAWALARAHARTGDAVAISSYLGGSDRFDRAITQFAALYGNQTVADHARFCAAINDGVISALAG